MELLRFLHFAAGRMGGAILKRWADIKHETCRISDVDPTPDIATTLQDILADPLYPSASATRSRQLSENIG